MYQEQRVPVGGHRGRYRSNFAALRNGSLGDPLDKGSDLNGDVFSANDFVYI